MHYKAPQNHHKVRYSKFEEDPASKGGQLILFNHQEKQSFYQQENREDFQGDPFP